MNECKFCHHKDVRKETKENGTYFECPVCGDYYLPDSVWWGCDANDFNEQQLKSYLFYHKKKCVLKFIGTEAAHNSYLQRVPNSTAILITPEIVQNWYPKRFSDKCDLALLKLAENTKYYGESIYISHDDALSLFFVAKTDTIDDMEEEHAYKTQTEFMLAALKDQNLINFEMPDDNSLYAFYSDYIKITITQHGFARIYELQKNDSQNKKVFVAMKYGDETKSLREKIREGLKGYDVRIMDEIEHNRQIVPEMLKEIRDCRFVVAELSHQSLGAYYEAGYALGLGKEVIHVCSSEALTNNLHFDVKQVNTVIYDNIDEIPQKLEKRVKGTIE